MFNIIVPAFLFIMHYMLTIFNHYEIDLKDCEEIDQSFENWTKTHYDEKMKIKNEEDLCIKERKL